MTLATLPPITEYRQEFTRDAANQVKSAWAQAAPDPYKQGGWWKEIVFSRISKLERETNADDFGTFNISEMVASKVRSRLSKVSLQSLPLPVVVPISGNGLSLTWATGTRSVEVTAFADGEVIIDALESDHYVEFREDKDLEAVLIWLIVPSEIRTQNATA
jgi:hypothetical protein